MRMEVFRSTLIRVNSQDDGSEDEEDQRRQHRGHGGRPRRRKRRKIQRPKRLLQDPCKIWFQVIDDTNISSGVIFWNEDQDDIPETTGGKLAVMSIGGFLNATVAIYAITVGRIGTMSVTKSVIQYTCL
jgi:hypothetical protein